MTEAVPFYAIRQMEGQGRQFSKRDEVAIKGVIRPKRRGTVSRIEMPYERRKPVGAGQAARS